MHIHAFGLRATIVLRDEILSWKVLHDAKSMGTAALDYAPARQVTQKGLLNFKKFIN